MGWLFKRDYSRKDLIDHLTKSWERTTEQGILVGTTSLAHCYRGGVFSGSLWGVWERTFMKEEVETEPNQRWITCDLLRYETGFGWGYKDMDESMHPYFFSCPLGYLKMVPIETFGGNEKWREGVHSYHARQKEHRQKRMKLLTS